MNDDTKRVEEALVRRDIDWHELSDSFDPSLSLIERQIFANADTNVARRKVIAQHQQSIKSLEYKIGLTEAETRALKITADKLREARGMKKRWLPDS